MAGFSSFHWGFTTVDISSAIFLARGCCCLEHSIHTYEEGSIESERKEQKGTSSTQTARINSIDCDITANSPEFETAGPFSAGDLSWNVVECCVGLPRLEHRMRRDRATSAEKPRLRGGKGDERASERTNV